MISIIVAIADDYGIGKNNELLWNIPEDLRRFKRLTTGKTVIMGKKTWESLPRKPLPNRRNIVITDVPDEMIEGAEMAYSIEEACRLCGDDENFIIGGGSIYRQFMPLCDRLYITRVHSTAPADVYFPEIELQIWQEMSREEYPGDNIFPSYSYIIYEKRRS